MEDLHFAAQLVQQLLSAKPHEYGARLKQGLNRSLKSNGLAPFDEHRWGYRKFSDFLTGYFGDKVIIERPQPFGDVMVSLRSATPWPHTSPTQASPKPESSTIMRNDVWQAFTNPDPTRKRFFNRATHHVLHFVENKNEEFERKLDSARDDYVEIERITADDQIGWMRAFLDIINLPEAERAPLDSMISGDYSSHVNMAFTKSLDSHEAEWRRYRSRQITNTIETWALQNTIKLEDLIARRSKATSPEALSPPAMPTALLTPRQQAIRLLELMSDDEVARDVIPVLLSSYLSKSQL
ncbi:MULTISPECIES: hypothetical protein [unclassified Pseudomonas]|uniref:hypothetical protein n=1 Tax=unclassified Pseudomonas TaxID=196821 RepID=UPI001B33A7D7|nr:MULTISPECIES: hypothetical protein [unclassified Pseudomonas]